MTVRRSLSGSDWEVASAMPSFSAARSRGDIPSTANGVGDSTIGRRGARGPSTIHQNSEGGDQTILIADDDVWSRKLLLRQLQVLGYAAMSTEDGREAFFAWRNGRFALLIVDCIMPEMDGYQLAREIRRLELNKTVRTPIIGYTASTHEDDVKLCFAAGMDDYLTKPVEIAVLTRRLAYWLRPQRAAGVPASVRDQRSEVRARLGELSGGDRAFEREFLDDLRQTNNEDLKAFRCGLVSRNCEVVARAAHRLKGASKLVGATTLAQLCQELEQAAKQKDWARIVQLEPAFVALYEQFAATLEAG